MFTNDVFPESVFGQSMIKQNLWKELKAISTNVSRIGKCRGMCTNGGYIINKGDKYWL